MMMFFYKEGVVDGEQSDQFRFLGLLVGFRYINLF